jgi:DNA ligase (NAD+)
MYNLAQTQALQQQTIQWLKGVNNTAYNLSAIETLRTILRFHEYRYYVQNDPLISDAEYDINF